MIAEIDERGARKIKVMQFQASSPEERLAHFDEVSGEMCSDEWRDKFRTFVEKFPPDAGASKSDPFAAAISEHSCIEGFLFKESNELPGCQKCRDAFWKLVDLVSLDW
jgi:hypothetical protein